MVKKRYGLIIEGGKPLYFDDKKSRQKIIDNIKNRITYSTFSKDILNPNCSEVIARLPVKTIAEGKKLLRSIGLDILRVDPYLHMHIMTQNGKIENDNAIIDPDNPNLPDFTNHARLSLRRTNYEEGEGIYIDGHQHCQVQLYPTIKKIQDELGIQFQGYDGGYNFERDFENWLNNGGEIKDYQQPLRDEIKRLLKEKKIKEMVENVFEVVDCIENKEHSPKEKYLLLRRAYKEYLEENKKALIKERREDERYKNFAKKESDDEIWKNIMEVSMWTYMDPMFNVLNDEKLRKIFLKDI